MARSLNEPIALIKTENRLCRNLAGQDMIDRINRWTVWEGSALVEQDTVLAIDLFASVIIAAKSKLNLIFKKVCEKAKRFYEITTFIQYAIADGIHRLLFASRTGPHTPDPPRFNGQLVFDFLKPLL